MLLIASLIVFSLLIYLRHQQMSILKRLGIPGPKPNFIFGNSIDIFREGSYRVFPKWTKKYGPIVGFYIGGRPQLLITDFDLIRQIFIKDFQLFGNRYLLIPGGIHPQPVMQKAISWAHLNLWKKIRSTVSPSFSSSKLKGMEQLMMSSINNMVNELDDKVKSGPECNMKPLAEELTFSIAAKSMLGLNLSLNSMTHESQSILKVVRPQLEKSILAMTMVLFPLLTFIIYPLRVWWETLRFNMLWSPEGVCYNIARKIVQSRKDAKIKSRDLLQLLMDSTVIQSTTDSDLELTLDDAVKSSTSNVITSERLSEEEVSASAIIFVLAGFETTSVTLQFSIYNLVNNQDVQDKLRKNLKEAVEDNNGIFDFQTLSKVTLLNNIIKETLRMFPPTTIGTSRVTEHDYKYKGYQIPKETGMFIGVTSIHNDPEIWPQPEKFQPDRFQEDYDKLAHLPFGVGPRNCIGMQFAYMVLQLALASLILKYKFEPSTKNEVEIIETTATLTTKNGVFCKVFKVEE